MKATLYLQLEESSRRGEAKVVRTTAKKPRDATYPVVKLVLVVPDNIFDPVAEVQATIEGGQFIPRVIVEEPDREESA